MAMRYLSSSLLVDGKRHLVIDHTVYHVLNLFTMHIQVCNSSVPKVMMSGTTMFHGLDPAKSQLTLNEISVLNGTLS